MAAITARPSVTMVEDSSSPQVWKIRASVRHIAIIAATSSLICSLLYIKFGLRLPSSSAVAWYRESRDTNGTAVVRDTNATLRPFGINNSSSSINRRGLFEPGRPANPHPAGRTRSAIKVRDPQAAKKAWNKRSREYGDRCAGTLNGTNGHYYAGHDDSSDGVNETAIVFQTHMPLRPDLLERVYDCSKELTTLRNGRRYIVALIVDVTLDERRRPWTLDSCGPVEDVARYYLRRKELSGPSSLDVPLPIVYNVTEEKIFAEFPKLLNYRNNGPHEKNVDNEPGDCCGASFVWQAMTPTATMFMHHYSQFEYVWRFEDDIGVLGRDSLMALVQQWDEELAGEGAIVDLAGQVTWANGIPINNRFVKQKHTPSFNDIVMRMGVNYNANRSRDGIEVWGRRHGEWECYTDALQRHSRRFSDELYKRISNNTFHFAECFVQPIAWDGNFTRRQLGDLARGTVGGLGMLTGRKKTRGAAMKEFSKHRNYATFLYHEERPKKKRASQRRRRLLLVTQQRRLWLDLIARPSLAA